MTSLVPLSEITNLVYDKLMDNNDARYPVFDLSLVENQECDPTHDCITFKYGKKRFKISIFEVSAD